MSSTLSNVAEKFQTFYLNPEGADVWFIFDNEKIPAHKFLLTTMIPWFKTMFLGSMPEDNEVDLSNTTTAEAFKEFLSLIYLPKATLSMDNIAGVMNLAKQSMNDDIFAECEDFLIKSVTADTMYFGYQLALLYDCDKLKTLCEGEICVNAEQTLRSSSFLNFPYEFLQNILQCDALACKEKYIFDACIAWARAACTRKDLDPLEAKNVRAQLKDTLHQIRFTSMSREETAACISSCPGLFSADELEEIICMTPQFKEYKANKFNWTQRYFNLQWDKRHLLVCDRNAGVCGIYKIEETEKISFSCSRNVLLKGFSCEVNNTCSKSVEIQITEKRRDDPDQTPIERYSAKLMLNFENKLVFSTKHSMYVSYEADVILDRAILLRPEHIYEIQITFQKDPPGTPLIDFVNRYLYKARILVDFDIILKFSRRRGIISKLSLCRFDRKPCLKKIASSPKAWFSKTFLP